VVLQSGEDPFYTKETLGDIISAIKSLGLTITLSLGERSFDEYRYWKALGADRYLMRHETADEELYEKLHPGDKLEIEKRTYWNLKD